MDVSAFFDNNIVRNDDFATLELEINGTTHVLKPEYLPIGLRSEVFTEPGTITRAEVFDSKGNRIYHSKGWDDRGTLNGAIVVSLPYEFTDKITLQLFCD